LTRDAKKEEEKKAKEENEVNGRQLGGGPVCCKGNKY